MKRRLLILTATLSFALGVCSAPSARSQDSAPRFDRRVRNDFLAGFAGNAEATVWLGAAKAFKPGQLFRNGGKPNGMALGKEGLALMNRAVTLAPDHGKGRTACRAWIRPDCHSNGQ